MKNFLWLFLLTMLFFTFISGAYGEANAPKKVLVKGDVEKFIKTFPLMYEDLERLGIEYQTEEGDVTAPKALKANKEFMAILKKNGWDETFVDKMRVILLAYYLLVYQDEMAKSKASMEESIAEIEADPDIDPATKKKLIDQLKESKGKMESGTSEQKNSIHNDDLELVRPHVKDLEAMFDQIGGDGQETDGDEDYDYED
jgi:hypothetical protein